MTIETEVLVVGASASGVCAAVQAARMGRHVVLCEPTGWVGGMLTGAGVSAVDGNHHLPSGLWGEFREMLRQHYGGPGALATGWVSHTLFDPRVGERILRSWIESLPGVSIYPYTDCVEVLRDGSRIAGAVIAGRPTPPGRRRPNRDDGAATSPVSPGPGERLTVLARVTILADEFGDAVDAAGLPWRTGLESREQTREPQAPPVAYPYPQDLTWAATIRAPASGFAAAGPGFSPGDEYERILGDPPITWDRLLDYGRLPGDLLMLNWPTQDYSGNYLDRSLRPAVLAAARAKTARLVEALRAWYGEATIGLPDIYPGHLAAIPYIREARRIFAIDSLTVDDLTNPDASLRTSIAVGDYPVDHHRARDPNAPKIEFPPVCAFGVPYGVMVPESHDGVLVAEKSIGVTGIVNGCTRLQPVVMQIGQAAGAAAAICAQRGVEPRSVPVAELQEVLLAAGVSLAPAMDAPVSRPDFAPLHRAAAAGDLTLEHVAEGWANRALIRPDERLSSADIARLSALNRPVRPGMTRGEYAVAAYGQVTVRDR